MEGGVGGVPKGTRSQGPADLLDFPHLSSPSECDGASPLLQVSSAPSPPKSLLGRLWLVLPPPSTPWGGTTSIRGVCTFRSGN